MDLSSLLPTCYLIELIHEPSLCKRTHAKFYCNLVVAGHNSVSYGTVVTNGFCAIVDGD